MKLKTAIIILGILFLLLVILGISIKNINSKAKIPTIDVEPQKQVIKEEVNEYNSTNATIQIAESMGDLMGFFPILIIGVFIAMTIIIVRGLIGGGDY